MNQRQASRDVREMSEKTATEVDSAHAAHVDEKYCRPQAQEARNHPVDCGGGAGLPACPPVGGADGTGAAEGGVVGPGPAVELFGAARGAGSGVGPAP